MTSKSISFLDLLRKGQYSLYVAIAEKGVFFLIFTYLARALSVTEYGTVTASFAFANILASFFEFGFAPYFQREAAAGSGRLEQEVRCALGYRLLAFVLYSGMAFAYFVWAKGIPLVVSGIISTTVFMYGFSSILSGVLFGLNRYVDSFKAMIGSRALFLVVAVLLVIFKTPYEYLLLMLLASGLLQSIVLARYLSRRGIHPSFTLEFGTLRTILASSLPIGIGLTFVWMYDKVDVLLIQRFIGPEAVSYYAVAYSLYKLPQILSGLLLLPFFSESSARYAGDGFLSLEDLLKPAAALLVTAAALIALFNMMPKFLLSFVYGENYSVSWKLLSLLSIALPGLFLNNLTGTALNALRKEKRGMMSAGLASILNILLNVSLLPLVGVVGAVAATITTEYAILALQFYFLFRSGRIRWQKTILSTTMRA